MRMEEMPEPGPYATGYVYDSTCERHVDEHPSPPGSIHPERPWRTAVIHQRLVEQGIVRRCVSRTSSRAATRDEIGTIHSQRHIDTVESTKYAPSATPGDIYYNEHTFDAALLSAGGVIDLIDDIASGKCRNGIANLRPPGHHAESEEMMGFCFFNNVAIAAKVAQAKHPDTIKRILILDWDVHHGNATENQFIDDDSVLYISLHRHGGGFYPGTGAHSIVGTGQGTGFNVNIPWSTGDMGDADYLLAFHHLIMPIATHFFRPILSLFLQDLIAREATPLEGATLPLLDMRT